MPELRLIQTQMITVTSFKIRKINEELLTITHDSQINSTLTHTIHFWKLGAT